MAKDDVLIAVAQMILANLFNKGKIETPIYNFLKFTNKEISKMPKPFKDIFSSEGRVVKYYKSSCKGRRCKYKVTYARHFYDISVSSDNLEDLKELFIKALYN